MRCAAWAYGVVAVGFGLFAAAIYRLERLEPWGPNHSNPPPPEDPSGETIATWFVLVAVPAVLLAVWETGRRDGAGRGARSACVLFTWCVVGAFLVFGHWRGAGIVSGLDAVLAVGGAVTVTLVLIKDGRRPGRPARDCARITDGESRA